MRQAEPARREQQASPNQTSQETKQGQQPSITLPKGGGAIRGIGEKFAANPVTGTGSMSVPIATSPGRSGFGPQLSLSYDSGAGNGPFGFGWRLSLPSITRKTDKGLPQYLDTEESDIFILSGAEDLVPEFEKDAAGNWVTQNGKHVIHDKPRTVNGVTYRVRRYRPRIEGLFARIERWTNQANPQEMFWRSISKENITTWYGKDNNSRIADPANPKRIFSWLICESHDDKGNVIVYRYKAEDSVGIDLSQAHERNRTPEGRSANRYLKHIRYGNHKPYHPILAPHQAWPSPLGAVAADGSADWFFEVVFDYNDHDANVPNPNDVNLWEPRQDPFSAYRAGFEVRTYRLCQRVLMFHHFVDEGYVGINCLVRSTDFNYSYEQNPTDICNPIYSFLLSVTQCGYKRQNDGYLKRCLPPVEFAYTQPIVQDEVEEVDSASLENLPIGLDGALYQWTDLHGEGIPGILTEQGGAWFYKRNLSPIPVKQDTGTEEVKAQFAPVELVGLQPNLALAGGAQFMDLAGDGQPDLVVMDGPMPGFYEHDGAEGWQPFRPFTARLNRAMNDPNLKFVDLDGDGHGDVLITEDDALVWHPSLAEAGFGPAYRIAQVLDEEKGPRLVFADGTQSIYLADLSGDGLTDLARIRNGEVCYWPNLGYGRFGAKVTMDYAPDFDNPEQFDQKRIRLADINGSGTTDIIYLNHDGVHLYFNQSGNSWSQLQTLRVFPHVDDLVSIVPTDLLGNGTACLVWSSPLPGDAQRPMRYVNLMGDQKPHLLVSVKNNLGAETRVHYRPSTYFYLKDKQDGKPWITRLPFPVHVVERVETWDHISHNRFVTRYAYHHGYFDGKEREFRGFGRVDQWDSEEYASLETNGELDNTTNWEAQSHVPPVLTKTWFHTGAYLENERISGQYADEYYREGDESLSQAGVSDTQLEAMLLPDTILPEPIALNPESQRHLTFEEQRQAVRALKGAVLRQEVYGLDDTEEADRPYSVSESIYTIEMLQPQATNQHAVFFTHPREAINFHYERKLFRVKGTTIVAPENEDPEVQLLADPRVTHSITLEVDEYGNVQQSVAIGYGRRFDIVDPSLEDEIVADLKAKQQQILITYTKNNYARVDETDQVDLLDTYRTPLPSKVCTYELINLKPKSGQLKITNLFTFNDIGDSLKEIDWDVPYEDFSHAKAEDKDRKYGRLIEHNRIRYRSNNLSRLLGLGELESLALPGESYQLAFTPGMLDAVYKREGVDLLPEDVRANILGGKEGDQGGYVVDEDGRWWIPSGRVFYHPKDVAAEQELAEAQANFFLPRRFQDPFGHKAMVTYDAHDLLVQETQDTLGNRVTTGERDEAFSIEDDAYITKSGNNYRVLQPELVTDPNGNRSAVAFDTLGLVAGTAVMGKVNEDVGDFLSDKFITDPTTELDDFFGDPKGDMAAILLNQATTRILYDLDRYQQTGQPAFAATLARETHVSDLNGEETKIQVSFAYSDGFGRVIQQKVQAEAGPVPQRNEETGKIMTDVNGQPLMTEASVYPRWVGSGWTVFNNKGKPVRQYEPFFTDRHDFEFDVRIGVSPVLYYDPVGRVVATLHPNHTYEKVIFDPWQQATYDVNDTVLNADESTSPKLDPDVRAFFKRLSDKEYLPTWYEQRINLPANNPERIAAEKAAIHRQTPTIAHFDALGRPVVSVAHNRFKPRSNGNGDNEPVEEYYATRTELDIEGKPLRIIDARGNAVMTYWVAREDAFPVTAYDVAGRQLYQHSMDAGERWTLPNVAGNPIRAWDSRGHTIRLVYDKLQRPTHWLVGHPEYEEKLAELTIYGESVGSAAADNLRGQIYRQYDGAGVVTNLAYDFKGNLLCSRRQLSRVAPPTSAYGPRADWTVLAGLSDVDAFHSAAQPLLEAETFESRGRYDALNRPVQQITPHHVAEQENKVLPNVIQPVYNDANFLERIDVWLRRDEASNDLLDPKTAGYRPVANVDYNAKGQRTAITYGNGVTTTYIYDWETFRLTHLLTKRNKDDFLDDCPQPPDEDWPGCHIQNLRYTYDPVGNITHIRDDAQQKIFFRNRCVEPSAEYNYDALYRLVKATGREHLGQNGPERPGPWDTPRINHDHPNDCCAMGNYTEWYEYDAVGNILAMRHAVGDAGWTRCYQYALDSNRLLSTGGRNGIVECPSSYGNEPAYSEKYPHDAHGNMIAMPHLKQMLWDFEDQMQQIGRGNGDGTATYLYDAGGQRVRKIYEHGGTADERIYLGGFEIYRRRKHGTPELVRETLHIMDGEQRVALVETKSVVDSHSVANPDSLIRYQIGNHLGSAVMELNQKAIVISFEEYYPYGSTSYQAVNKKLKTAAKHYRYTGKERDKESGLIYCRARYFVSWLGIWTSYDPLTKKNGNKYSYCNNNPIVLLDPNGLDSITFETGSHFSFPQDQTSEKRLHLATEMMVNEIKNHLQEYFGIYTKVLSISDGYSLTVDFNATKEKEAQHEQKIKTMWEDHIKKHKLRTEKTDEKLAQLIETRQKILGYFKENPTINIETESRYSEKTLFGAEAAVSSFGYIQINPYTFYLLNPETGQMEYSRNDTPVHSRVRMGPLGMLLHEFAHRYDKQLNERYAVDQMDKMMSFHLDIPSREEYKLEEFRTYIGQKVPLASRVRDQREWFSFPEEIELAIGIKQKEFMSQVIKTVRHIGNVLIRPFETLLFP